MNEITPENVKLKDWIYVGMNEAVVCHIYENYPGKIEVVYIGSRDRAINEDVYYKDGKWTFVNEGPNGGYADNSSRLVEYVSILRSGRWKI